MEHLDLVEEELGNLLVAIKHDLRSIGVLVSAALRGYSCGRFLRLTFNLLLLARAARLVALILLLLLQVLLVAPLLWR